VHDYLYLLCLHMSRLTIICRDISSSMTTDKHARQLVPFPLDRRWGRLEVCAGQQTNGHDGNVVWYTSMEAQPTHARRKLFFDLSQMF
jgi:hypothetical protein